MATKALAALIVAAATAAATLVTAGPASAQAPPGATQVVTDPGAAPAEAAADAPVYRHPVEGPVVDGFRPPARPWLPGNRGLEYATFPGEAVVAAAGGVVMFAGSVARTLHVTILHDDGLRTSYSFLASVDVSEGSRILAGAVVGRAARRVHFGVRDPSGTYLDPGGIIGHRPTLRAHLAPHDDEAVEAAAIEARRREERSTLGRLVGAVGSAGSWVGERVADGVETGLAAGRLVVDRLAWTAIRPVVAVRQWVELGTALTAAVFHPPECTPASIRPAPPEGPRVAVLVPGLHSPADGGPISDLDMAALGIMPADVVLFSYDGGRLAGATVSGDPPWYGPIEATVHRPEASRQSVARSADLLADLIDDIRRLRPDAAIELYGYSIGGMVAVTALGRMSRWEVPASVRVVTLASPHAGVSPASTVDLVGGLPGLGGLARRLGLPVGSPVLEDLASGTRASLPAGVQVLSVAAVGDPLVPAVRTTLEGATSVSVGSGFSFEHDGVVGREATSREIGLFLASRPPACRSLIDRISATVVPRLIQGVHEMVSFAGPVDGFVVG